MAEMVRMVTTAEHQYFGRRLLPGDEYDCEPQHVEIFKNQGWVRPKDGGDQAQHYRTRDMTVAGRGRRRSRSVEATK